MAVNLAVIKDLLLPGLRGVEGKYEMIPSQIDKIFTKHNSKMALERTAEMRFLGRMDRLKWQWRVMLSNISLRMRLSGSLKKSIAF